MSLFLDNAERLSPKFCMTLIMLHLCFTFHSSNSLGISRPQGRNGADRHAGRHRGAGDWITIRCSQIVNDGIEPASGKSENSLSFLAATDFQAFAAKNAAIGIVVQLRVAPVDFRGFESPIEMFRLQPHFQIFGHILQGTFPVGRTVAAVHAVYRQQQLQSGFLKSANGRCICPHDHARFDHPGAGGQGLLFTLDFDKAQSTGGWCRTKMLHET